MLVSNGNDHDTFLHAIHAAPEEDTPRLVYADWLEESGEEVWLPLAELIRVQVELTGKTKKSKRRKMDLKLREQELLTALPGACLGPWSSPLVQWSYRRGIPERIEAFAAGLLVREDGNPRLFLQADGDTSGEQGRQRIVFQADGQLRLEEWDRYEGSFSARWYGSYQVVFTYAQVRLKVEIWRNPSHGRNYFWDYTDWLPAAEHRYRGEFRRSAEGLRLELWEEATQRKQKSESYLLTFCEGCPEAFMAT
jgi:uncharacterized protein (TIGR02996 family)